MFTLLLLSVPLVVVRVVPIFLAVILQFISLVSRSHFSHMFSLYFHCIFGVVFTPKETGWEENRLPPSYGDGEKGTKKGRVGGNSTRKGGRRSKKGRQEGAGRRRKAKKRR